MSLFPPIYEDDHYIVIDKPPGHHVHPPENGLWRVPKHKICLYLVRDFLGNYVYPAHRLDAATGGLLVFGKSSEAARRYQEKLQNQSINKRYLAVIRGHCSEAGRMDQALLSDSSDLLLDSITIYKRWAHIEIPEPVGKRHSTARYSLIEALPKTGRYHQIRRHCAGLAHPIIGDINHGDSHHNRFFRERLEISGLLLHSFELDLNHPFTDQPLKIKSPWNARWQKVFALFQFQESNLD